MNKVQQDLRLLPLHFKKIAFAIMILSILFAIVSKSLPGALSIDKDIIMSFTKSGFLISLLILAITRNKIEDELTLKIRLKAFTASFIYGVVIVIIQPFFNSLFRSSFTFDKNATELLISMFFFYFIMAFLMKKNR